jgi:Do/DeqQ family serine protease
MTAHEPGTPRRVVRNSLAAIGTAALVATLAGVWSTETPRLQAQAPVTGASHPRTLEPTGSYADLVARVSPAVVTIRSVRTVRQTQLPFDPDFMRRFFGDGPGAGRMRPHREGGLGSGVVVAPDGYILTNHHVVQGAEKISVDLGDGRSLEARVVGSDEPSDLAVLKVPATGLHTVPLGNSDEARVGDVVLALGNPLGIGQTVTLGIVSAKGRATGGGDGAFEDFIQTDAPINQGNSGGALVDTRGELIGINTQILSPSGYNIGIGFAIPVNMARAVMTQLIEHGAVTRGKLGVTVQGITGELAASLGLESARGAIVSGVEEGSPAARAGLQVGDVILALDGKPLDSSNSLRNQVAPLGPGARVELSVLRDGRERTVAATLAELPATRPTAAPSAEETEHGRYGMSLEALTPALARQLGLEPGRGVVVAEVAPDGVAVESGLQSGDVLEQVNGTPVATAADVRRALQSARGGRPSLLLVNRRGARLFLALAEPGVQGE